MLEGALSQAWFNKHFYWVGAERERIIPYSPMDWGPFSRMTDEDITAIWMYLNSLKPVKNEAEFIKRMRTGRIFPCSCPFPQNPD
jgi:hypothetical protein